MTSGGRYAVCALAGAALTAAGFLLFARPAAAPLDGFDASRASASVAGGDGTGTAADAPDVPGLSRDAGSPPSREEAAFLDRALREERRRGAAAVIRPEDSGLDLLRRFHDDGADLASEMASYERLASHVRPGSGKVARVAGGNGTTKVLLDELGDVEILEFGAGTFEINRGRKPWGIFSAPVRSIEIRGAGIDATVLRMNATLIHAEKGVESLRIRDLTFEAANTGTFLSIHGDAALAVDGVRIRSERDDVGSAFYVGDRALLAFHDCAFEGTGKPYPFRIRGDVVALFERCSFVDVRAPMQVDPGTVRHGIARYERCEFRGSSMTDAWGSSFRGRPAFPIHVRGSRVGLGPAHWSDGRRKTQWGLPAVATVEDTAFEPDAEVPTLGDLVRALAAARNARAVPIQARLVSPRRGARAATYRVFSAIQGERPAASLVSVDPTSARAMPDSGSNDSLNWHASNWHASKTPPILEVLEASPVARSESVRSAVLQTFFVDGHDVAAIHLESDDPHPGWMLDATTGGVLSRPKTAE